VVLSDARDLDPEESVALAGSGVRMAAIGEVGDCVPGDQPIYVHLDVDVVTPGEMPALRFPAAGGPTLAQVADALRVLARTERIVCATIGCTWDPARPRAAEAVAATEMLVSCLTAGPP
jgi:arginase